MTDGRSWVGCVPRVHWLRFPVPRRDQTVKDRMRCRYARVNAVVAPDDCPPREVIDYLEQAPGVTGQLLSLDDG